jgi:hypothetical protein
MIDSKIFIPMETNRKRQLHMPAALRPSPDSPLRPVSSLPAYFSGRDRMVPVTPERIASVRFSHQFSSQNLERKSGRWNVVTNGKTFPADASRVDSLLSSIVGLSRDSIVSRNPDNHAKFGIGNDKMIIRADREYTVYLGKNRRGHDRNVRVGTETTYTLPVALPHSPPLPTTGDLSLKAVARLAGVSAITVRPERRLIHTALAKRNAPGFPGKRRQAERISRCILTA